jgi:hypothetical protein
MRKRGDAPLTPRRGALLLLRMKDADSREDGKIVMNLYVSYYSAPYLTRVNLDTLTREAAIDLTPADYIVDAIVIGDYIYLVSDEGLIIKVDLPTFSEVNRLTLALGGAGSAPHKCTYNNGILYIAGWPYGPESSSLIRVNIPTFTEIDYLGFNKTYPEAPIISGNYLYIALGTVTPDLRRITLVPFALDSTINLSKRYVQCSVIVGTNLYLGHSVSPAVITKVDLTTFTETAVITFLPGENWCWSIVSDGTYLYCGLASAPGTPGVIVRVDLAAFTRVDSLTLPLTEPDIWNLYLYNGFLWALTEGWPTHVVKINLTSFIRIDGLELDATEGDSWAGALWTPAKKWKGNILIDQLIYQHAERMVR